MAKKNTVPKKWRKLFDEHLPGYDPIATAKHFVFVEKYAEKVVTYFPNYCCHIEGDQAGEPFYLEPWQQAMDGCVFGWVHPKTGKRRYREVFQYTPRKNGKTCHTGGIINFIAFCDGEAGAQLYSVAADHEQATLVFRQAKGMLEANPLLASQVQIFKGHKSIDYPNNNVFKVLSATDGTKHGLNPHLVIDDELHAHKNPETVNVLITGTGNRTQPLIWHTTTADFARESACNEKLKYAEKVRDGEIDDPAFLPVIYAATADEDWTDPKVWAKHNPNLGVSISLEYLERECKRAQEVAAYENTFKRLHLNMPTQQDIRWIQLEAWDRNGGDIVPEYMRYGRPCWAGLDIGSTSDLTALTLLFRYDVDGETDHYEALWWFWVPRGTAFKRERKDKVPYSAWANSDYLTYTEGDETDYNIVRRDINEIMDRYGCKKIAVDRLFQGAQLCQQLAGDGLEVINFGMGFMSMATPCNEFERLINRGEFRHGDNPVARWMAGNVTVAMDPAGNIKPDKAKSTEKIDGIVSAIMALGISMLDQHTTSVYEQAGRMSLLQ